MRVHSVFVTGSFSQSGGDSYFLGDVAIGKLTSSVDLEVAGTISASLFHGDASQLSKVADALAGKTIPGDLRLTGHLIAEQLIVSSSTVNYVTLSDSGSTNFGNSSDDTHEFTGSLYVTGSITLNGQPVGATASYVQWSGIDNIPVDIVSSSAQLATAISGAFTATSASLASRITVNSSNFSALNAKTLISSSAQIATDISGAFTSTSASLASRITSVTSDLTAASSSLASRITTNSNNFSALNAKTLVSSSAQIDTEISGAFAATSASLASRITTNASNFSTLNAKTLISSSAQIATDISGAFTATSASFSTTVTLIASDLNTLESDFASLEAKTLVSSSAQIASDISGAFTATSASLASRVTTNSSNFSTLNAKTLLSSSNQIATKISGAFTATSSSLASRITTNSSNFSTLNAKTLLSSSAQIATDISGAFTATSASLASRITVNSSNFSTLNAKTLISSSAQFISNSDPFSGSFHGSFSGDGSELDNLPGGLTPGGADTQIQYNDAGALGGLPNFTINETTKVITISGSIVNMARATYISGSIFSGSGFYGDGAGLFNIATSSITDFPTEVSRSAALFGFGAGEGVADHGALTGLGDDDHTQYVLSNGSRNIIAAGAKDWQVRSTDSTSQITISGSNPALLLSDNDGGGVDYSLRSDGASFYLRDITAATDRLNINGSTGIATFTSDVVVPTEVYGVAWNGSNEVPTKDAVYDIVSATSSSLASRVTTNSSNFSTLNAKTLISSSNQIDTEISGAFTATSSSLASRITINTTNFNTLNAKTLVSSSAQFKDGSAPFSGSFSGSFKGDGTGLTGVSATASPGGSTTQVQYNNAGTLAGTNLLKVVAANVLHISGSTLASGSITARSFTETSALRFKDNIESIESGDIIYKLRPVSYNWKYSAKEDFGLIAEELLPHIPELVSKNPEGEIFGIQYSKLTVFLIKALQDQNKEIEFLKEEIKQIKSLL